MARKLSEMEVCAFCGETIALDDPDAGKPDWETLDDEGEGTGDFGCGSNPINDDEGSGGHHTFAELLRIYAAAEAVALADTSRNATEADRARAIDLLNRALGPGGA